MTTRTFTGANNTYYTVAANWSPSDAYPDQGDTAVITSASVSLRINTMLTNVTWNVTNSTITGHGSGNTIPGLTANGGFTVNLSGTNTISIFLFTEGAAAFNQAADGTTTLSDMITVDSGTLTLTAGTFVETTELLVINQLVVNANFQSQSAGSININEGSAEIMSGATVSSAISVSSGGTLYVDFGAAVTGELYLTTDGSSGQKFNDSVVFRNQNYASFNYDGTTLTIGNYSFSDTIDAGHTFYISHVGADTVLSTTPPPCFLAGSRILTSDGPIPVEDLSIGTRLSTLSGAFRPIKWIGRRSYGTRFVKANPCLQPVLFEAGSLGNGLPHRALSVSPDHAMYLDRVLIPACALVNRKTIRIWTPPVDVRYYHIELETHDIIFAEGAATETFLDDDSRGMFHNAPEFSALYPDPQPQGRFCAPMLEAGFELEAIRNKIAARGTTVRRAAA